MGYLWAYVITKVNTKIDLFIRSFVIFDIRNDLTLLRLSDINRKFKNMQLNKPLNEQFRIFGDSAYKMQSHILSYLSGETITETAKAYNYAMKSVRISIEW